MHGDRDVGFAALVLPAHQGGGEGGGLSRAQADDRLVEALQQGAGADLVGDPAGLRVLQLLAVDRGGQVDRDVVALLGRPVDADEGGEALPQRLEALVDLLLGDLGVVDGDLDALVVGDLELGADVDFGGEGQLLAVLRG